jgi:serine/threonine protein kinase
MRRYRASQYTDGRGTEFRERRNVPDLIPPGIMPGRSNPNKFSLTGMMRGKDVIYVTGNPDVVVKRTNRNEMHITKLMQEFQYVSHIPHGFKAWFEDEHWWLPLIYIPLSLLPDLPIGPITAAQHLMLALKHIHSKHIMHLDIKPANTGVKDGRLVLLDFGSARRGHAHTSPDGGTYQYMSQRRATGETYGFEEDLVGAGVTLFQVFLKNDQKFPWMIPSKEYPDGLRLSKAFANDNMTKEAFLELNVSVRTDIANTLYDMIFPTNSPVTRLGNYPAFDDYSAPVVV